MMNRIAVAPASPAEQAACLALLPEARGLAPELLIARLDGEVAGAAAISWASWNDPPGFPLTIQVIPDARRKGVGRRLAEEAITLATGETAALLSLRPVPVESEAAAFLRACGFVEQRRTLTFDVRGTGFYGQISRIVERLRRHGRIPEAARILSLRDAPLEDVARVVSVGLARGSASLLALLRSGLREMQAGGIDPDKSVVVMEGDAVAGALLYRLHDGRCLVEANVVAPAWRNGYVNALQLAAAAQNAFVSDAAGFQFDCDEDVVDSINIARRNGGELVATKALFRYALAS